MATDWWLITWTFDKVRCSSIDRHCSPHTAQKFYDWKLNCSSRYPLYNHSVPGTRSRAKSGKSFTSSNNFRSFNWCNYGIFREWNHDKIYYLWCDHECSKFVTRTHILVWKMWHDNIFRFWNNVSTFKPHYQSPRKILFRYYLSSAVCVCVCVSVYVCKSLRLQPDRSTYNFPALA